MAKRPSPSNNGAKRVAALPAPTEIDLIVDAALGEAAAMGWRHLSMSAVAVRAGLELGVVLTHAPTRVHVLALLLDRLDRRMLAGVKTQDEADSVRDRVRAVVTGLRFDPGAAAFALCRADRTAAAILAAAGVSPDGLLGYARIQGMKVVLLCAVRAWIDDDSADLSKTMAALDRALERAERIASFRGFRRPAPEAA